MGLLMSGKGIKIRIISLIVPLFILVLALATGNVLIWHLFSLSVLVLLIGYLWVRLGIRGIQCQVKKSRDYYQAGEWFDEEIVIRNASLLPKLLVKVGRDTNLPGHNSRLAINLPPRGAYHWQNKVYCQLRGWYHLEPLTVEVVDPFGLFPVRWELGEPQDLLVYPATVELPLFWLASSVKSGAGRNNWLTTEPAATVSRVREYVPGDSLGHIHWRTTAHAGKLMAKDFDIDLSQDIWVLLDMSKTPLGGSGTDTIEEYCVTVAASIVRKYVDASQRVGLIAQGDNFYLFPPQPGRQHFGRVMEALAVIRAAGEVPINQLIDQEIVRFTGNSSVLVITGSASDEMAASLLRLNRRGVDATVILLDARSFGGTVNPLSFAGPLTSSGIPVYIVKRGDDLAIALDSQGFTPANERLTEVA
jgi:uncharacterized protein (DUF58 family)